MVPLPVPRVPSQRVEACCVACIMYPSSFADDAAHLWWGEKDDTAPVELNMRVARALARGALRRRRAWQRCAQLHAPVITDRLEAHRCAHPVGSFIAIAGATDPERLPASAIPHSTHAPFLPQRMVRLAHHYRTVCYIRHRGATATFVTPLSYHCHSPVIRDGATRVLFVPNFAGGVGTIRAS